MFGLPVCSYSCLVIKLSFDEIIWCILDGVLEHQLFCLSEALRMNHKLRIVKQPSLKLALCQATGYVSEYILMTHR